MNIGIVGIGNMGGAMAQRLLECGHTLSVHDIDHERRAQARAYGAQVCDDAAAVARQSSLLIVAVVDAVQTDAVLFGPGGAADALAAGSVLMLCPTVAPQDVQRWAQDLSPRGILAIDAPMSGGPARARDGSMSLMVACSDAAYDQVQPVLCELSSKLFRVGQQPGDGARTKLVNNLLAAVNLAAAAEAMLLAQRLGLDPAATLAVIESSSGQSWIGSERMRRVLAGDTAVQAHIGLLAKDSRLALQAAQAAGFAPALGSAAEACFAAACAQGLSAEDDAGLWHWLARQLPD